MTPARILETLAAAGVTVRREGNSLRLKPGSTGTVPADVVELVRAHKAELLAELDGTLALRTRLLELAASYAIPAEIVQVIATDDALGWCLGMTDAELTRWANIVCTREMYRRGLLKHGWLIPEAAHVQGCA